LCSADRLELAVAPISTGDVDRSGDSVKADDPALLATNVGADDGDTQVSELIAGCIDVFAADVGIEIVELDDGCATHEKGLHVFVASTLFDHGFE